MLRAGIENCCQIFGRWEMYHRQHHIVLAARISLTLSRHSSLSFIALGRSSGLHPVSSHSCWMYVSCWSSYFCAAVCGDPKEYISYEFISASPAMSSMSGSPNLNRFRDRGQVAVQLVSRGVPLPGLVENYIAAFLGILPSSFFSSRFVSVHVAHPYSSIDVTAAWKKLKFHFNG